MDEWINEHEIVRAGTDEEKRSLEEKDAKEKERHKHKSKSAGSAAAADAVGGAAAVGVADADAKSTRTRGQKRKVTDDHEFAPPDEHDEHEGMDAASIREHEEVTKVKVGWVSE